MAVNDGDLLKVVITFDAPNLVVMQNVHYWQLSDPTPDNPSNAQILTALDTRITTLAQQLDDRQSNAYEWSDISVERVEWNTDHWETVENIGDAVIGVTGLAGGDAVPHGVALTITGTTSRPQTRARKFLPGVGEADAEDSTWSGALLGAAANYVSQWLLDIPVVGAAELIPVVLGQSGPSAGIEYALLAGVISAIAGYQRRRKPGVGV